MVQVDHLIHAGSQSPSSHRAKGHGLNNLSAAMVQTNSTVDMTALVKDSTIARDCRDAVLELFPDICPDYLEQNLLNHDFAQDAVIAVILDQSESGKPYPKRQNPASKRKHDAIEHKEEDMPEEDGSDVQAVMKRYLGDDFKNIKQYHPVDVIRLRKQLRKELLMHDFPYVSSKDIVAKLQKNDGSLLDTCLELDEIFASWDEGKPRLALKKTRTKHNPDYAENRIEDTIRQHGNDHRTVILKEFRAARHIRRVRQAKRTADREQQRKEEANLELARAEGTIASCGCCYDDYAMNRMVHCDGGTVHWFCKGCAKMNAEYQIGSSKYELQCMSTDGCSGIFPPSSRGDFLDEKSIVALDRLDQEAQLRMAGIENLASCPFCPYAAEYPPVDVDKEFRCQRPGCEVVSCRLCKEETHVPKSCEELARDKGYSARHTIEEAMSAALIRKCKECNTPFIKENGCNKMTCTRLGCHNIQCYICSQARIDYTHFNDPLRGGKSSNCPLWDTEHGLEARHKEEVRVAEEKARNQVAKENPNVDATLLQFHVSSKVKQNDWHLEPVIPKQHIAEVHDAAALRRHAEQRLAGLDMAGMRQLVQTQDAARQLLQAQQAHVAAVIQQRGRAEGTTDKALLQQIKTELVKAAASEEIRPLQAQLQQRLQNIPFGGNGIFDMQQRNGLNPPHDNAYAPGVPGRQPLAVQQRLVGYELQRLQQQQQLLQQQLLLQHQQQQQQQQQQTRVRPHTTFQHSPANGRNQADMAEAPRLNPFEIHQPNKGEVQRGMNQSLARNLSFNARNIRDGQAHQAKRHRSQVIDFKGDDQLEKLANFGNEWDIRDPHIFGWPGVIPDGDRTV